MLYFIGETHLRTVDSVLRSSSVMASLLET